MEKYTVWVGRETGLGTTYVTVLDAPSVNAAMDAAIVECITAWESDPFDDLVVRGVARGEVELLYWHDLDE